MSELKVLHVYRTYFPDPPGGLQEAIRQIAISTSRKDVQSRIYTLSPSPVPGVIERAEGTVFRARSYMAPASCDLGGSDAFRGFSRAAQWADVINYHFPWPFADVLHFAARTRKPSVLTYHSDVVGKGVFGRLYGPLMKRMLKSMDSVVATSPAYAATSTALRKHVDPAKLSVIPLGIEEESYRHARETAKNIDVSTRFGVEKGRFFLFVGVLRKYKGLDYLVAAARHTDLPVVIAGSGPELDRIAEMSRAVPNIRLVGQVDDAEKMALVETCRAAVLPSHLRSEAFGVFLIEAAMCAKPMISCEIGTGTSFVNRAGETGIVVPPQRPDILGQALQAIAADDDLAGGFGRAARRRYEALFSGNSLGTAYHDLYRALANPSGRR
ncbi:MAG: D-rhamnosyltransferase WbpZ [Oricola sp.]